MLTSVQRRRDHPVAGGGRRELVGRREVTGLGLAAGASPEDVVLVVVAGRAQRRVIVHAGNVALPMPWIGGGARRHTDRRARYRNGAECFANHLPPRS